MRRGHATFPSQGKRPRGRSVERENALNRRGRGTTGCHHGSRRLDQQLDIAGRYCCCCCCASWGGEAGLARLLRFLDHTDQSSGTGRPWSISGATSEAVTRTATDSWLAVSPRKTPLVGGTSRIAADRGPEVPVSGHEVICGIEAHPTKLRQKGFYPGMGRTVGRAIVVLDAAMQVSTHVPARYAQGPHQRDHNVCEVLTYSLLLRMASSMVSRPWCS